MPRLTKEELRNVTYVSMADFAHRFDEMDDINDKVAFATRYVLSYGASNDVEPDYSIEEVVHIVRMKLADASAELKERFFEESETDLEDYPHVVNPYVQNEAEDLAAEMIMGNPAGYFKGSAEKLAHDLPNSSKPNKNDADLYYNCKRLAGLIFVDGFNKGVTDLEKSPVFDIKVRMENRLGSKQALVNSIDATKGGFMSRLFGTSSNAYKNLDAAYKAFNNPNHVNYGDMDTMERASNQYLRHVFPSWKPGDGLPKAADIAKLGDTQKARAQFCVNMLTSIEEERAIEEDFPSLTRACENRNIDFSSVPQPNQELDDNQVNFQAALGKDMEELEDSKDINPNEIGAIKENQQEISQEAGM